MLYRGQCPKGNFDPIQASREGGGAAGPEVVVHSYEPGTFIGEKALVQGGARSPWAVENW